MQLGDILCSVKFESAPDEMDFPFELPAGVFEVDFQFDLLLCPRSLPCQVDKAAPCEYRLSEIADLHGFTQETERVEDGALARRIEIIHLDRLIKKAAVVFGVKFQELHG